MPMAKVFERMVYILERENAEGKWVAQFAIVALATLRQELVDKGFKLPSAVTMKAHIDKNGSFESGSVKIYDLGLFKTKYSGDVSKNFNKKK